MAARLEQDRTYDSGNKVSVLPVTLNRLWFCTVLTVERQVSKTVIKYITYDAKLILQ